MKIKNISLLLAASLSMGALSGCGIYSTYSPEKVNSAVVNEYAQALEQTPEADALGNLDWHKVFTDPMLTDLIERALANNKDLRNAKLNVDIAHAQLKGARLSYLPSVAFAPSANRSFMMSQWSDWSYQLPSLSTGRLTSSASCAMRVALLRVPSFRPRPTSRLRARRL